MTLHRMAFSSVIYGAPLIITPHITLNLTLEFGNPEESHKHSTFMYVSKDGFSSVLEVLMALI